VFFTKTNTTDLDTSNTVKAAKRARAASSAAAANATDAAQNAVVAAKNAKGVAQAAARSAAVVAANTAQNASDAAQTAATGLSAGVRQRVYTARSWVAPRLESAADYTTATVAPKVSSALRTTARQVSPADNASSKRNSVLPWAMLAAAILAGLGAAAAVLRHRYRAAIAADSEAAEEEALADSSGTKAAPSAAAKPTDQGTDTSVNGRVAASGW
jgi:hypothetical protein